MTSCFLPANILLPNKNIDMKKWAVIACDQYTSQPEYWEEVKEFVGASESTLNLIYPEAFLEENNSKTDSICKCMKDYLRKGIINEDILNCFILVERQVNQGIRIGLIGVIDLEQYDYNIGSEKLIRATEGTVLSRIPPRVAIRSNAVLECPHVMVLIDDPKKKLIEPVVAQKAHLRKLYDFDLMFGGGNIKGSAIEGEMAISLISTISKMQKESNNFFLAVGDGNHSLATAKTCWDKIKSNLTKEEMSNHPARFSMVEVINLHDPSLLFEPIHRIIYNCESDSFLEAFNKFILNNGLTTTPGDQVAFIDSSGTIGAFSINGLGNLLPIDIIQRFLDLFATENEAQIDYIHGDTHVMNLVKNKKAVGILLNSIDKHSLFPAIEAGGVLPRKTFSIGEADEKKFYVECRKITIE